MSEKEYSNEFKFSLHQENVLLCEKIFDADQFNPFTRYSIDIREILPRAITKLQKTLCKRNYLTKAEVGRVDVNSEESTQIAYDLYGYVLDMIDLYPREWRDGMYYDPEPIIQQIEEKTIRGVECKIGFYINDKTIVERVFYVDGFNPTARWSIDIVDTVDEIADTIFNQIKRSDVRNMWDDYDMINVMGLTINQIREFNLPKREEMLRKLRRITEKSW